MYSKFTKDWRSRKESEEVRRMIIAGDFCSEAFHQRRKTLGSLTPKLNSEQRSDEDAEMLIEG